MSRYYVRNVGFVDEQWSPLVGVARQERERLPRLSEKRPQRAALKKRRPEFGEFDSIVEDLILVDSRRLRRSDPEWSVLRRTMQRFASSLNRPLLPGHRWDPAPVDRSHVELGHSADPDTMESVVAAGQLAAQRAWVRSRESGHPVRGTTVRPGPVVDGVCIHEHIQSSCTICIIPKHRTFGRHVDLENEEWEQAYLADHSVEAPFDFVGPSRSKRVADFHDLLDSMAEVPTENVLSGRKPRWNGSEFDSWHDLAARLNRFQFNEDYFDGFRIPPRGRAGFLAIGSAGRFIYFPDGVFCVSLTRRFTESSTWDDPVPVYTVWWRESVGTETLVKGPGDSSWRRLGVGESAGPEYRRFDKRVFAYHRSRSFSHLDDARGFAERLAAKARLEADLAIEALTHAGEQVRQGWDRDEFSYDPWVLSMMVDGREDADLGWDS